MPTEIDPLFLWVYTKTMKYMALIILISFAAIGIFGYSAMHHDSLFSKCANAMLPQNMPCEVGHDVAMAIAHANIYHAFSASIVSAIFSLLALAGFLFGVIRIINLGLLTHNFAHSIVFSNSYFKQLSWLTLFEKRDPACI